jgi:hypothetical protein
MGWHSGSVADILVLENAVVTLHANFWNASLPSPADERPCAPACPPKPVMVTSRPTDHRARWRRDIKARVHYHKAISQNRKTLDRGRRRLQVLRWLSGHKPLPVI